MARPYTPRNSALPPAGTFGARLREARVTAGLSQLGLARRIECTNSCIAKWEAGLREPSLADLEMLSVALERSIDWLVVGPPRAIGARNAA